MQVFSIISQKSLILELHLIAWYSMHFSKKPILN